MLRTVAKRSGSQCGHTSKPFGRTVPLETRWSAVRQRLRSLDLRSSWRCTFPAQDSFRGSLLAVQSVMNEQPQPTGEDSSDHDDHAAEEQEAEERSAPPGSVIYRAITREGE